MANTLSGISLERLGDISAATLRRIIAEDAVRRGETLDSAIAAQRMAAVINALSARGGLFGNGPMDSSAARQVSTRSGDDLTRGGSAMNVPPKGALCGGKGGRVGLSSALRALRVGDERDCPMAWEQGVGAAAQRLGIKVVTRRLADHETVRVYRIE